MRISVSYLYTIFKYGYPPSVDDSLKALPELQKLGFRFLEMEGLGRENLQELYKRRNELRDVLSSCNLHVHNFCVVDPDLVNLNLELRQRALDRFRMGAELAELLGSETMLLASYAPPVEYLQRPPYQLSKDGGYRFEDTTRLRLPANFDWNDVWAVLVESTRMCSDIAADHHRLILMEPRIGEVICSVDSLLRLIEYVDRANLKANFDTAHFSAQRENVILAIAKLNGHFANVHVADNHPSSPEHLPIGNGSIEWKEFLSTLQHSGYNGYLGLDLGLSADLPEAYQRSAKRLQETAAELNLEMEL